MEKPVITLSGSSAVTLLEDYRTALDALSKAERALSDCMPHGRDYQGQDEKYRMARAQHVNRLEHIRTVHHEIEMLAEYVSKHVK